MKPKSPKKTSLYIEIAKMLSAELTSLTLKEKRQHYHPNEKPKKSVSGKVVGRATI